ncbi:MAG: hypothetical protein GY798_00785 [Hyphomicrobiales bacterium]|nr:hypothetical protein [Hyphomicrobiales bacterium]
MKEGPHRSSHDILSDVRSQFERWRQGRKRGTRIPETLWQAAVEAAGECGVSKASQALGLDYYGLKKRVESTLEVSDSEPAAGREFLEIPLFASAADCVLEMVDAEGTRLRVELRGSAAAHCQTLAQALWSVTR